MPSTKPIQPDEIVTAPKLPTQSGITVPSMVAVQEVTQPYSAEELLAATTLGKESKAYPVSYLLRSPHVNDKVGGQPVLLTWCYLCFAPFSYSRIVDGKEYTFGSTNKLARNALVLYDEQTNSLWSQLTGEAIVGPMNGAKLQPVPSELTDWDAWTSEHPNGMITASANQSGAAPATDPYVAYYIQPTAGPFGPGSVDPMLEDNTYILGLALGSAVRAYPYRLMRESQIVNDVLGGTVVAVAFDRETNRPLVYERDVSTTILTFTIAEGSNQGPGQNALTLIDRDTGSQWNALSGEAIAGTWKGHRLSRLPSTIGSWRLWKHYYPNSEVYS